MALKEFALYKGEEVIAIGTVEEISNKTGLKKATLYGYGKEKNKNRKTVMIEIDMTDVER